MHETVATSKFSGFGQLEREMMEGAEFEQTAPGKNLTEETNPIPMKKGIPAQLTEQIIPIEPSGK